MYIYTSQYGYGLWTMDIAASSSASSLNSSKDMSHDSQNVIPEPEFEALSNGEHFWSL
jgi:hypothetical protein